MGGHQGHAQAAGGEHHHHLFAAREVGEKLGVPGEGDAGVVDHALMHRCSDHSGEMPIQAALGGAGQGFQDVGGVGLIQLSGSDWCGQRRIPHIKTTCRA